MSKFNLKEDVTWKDVLIRTAIIIGAVAVVTWFMPRDSRSSYRAELGKPWKYADFTAPFDFPIYKSESAVKKERDSVINNFEPYFNINKDTEGNMVRKFVRDYNDGIPGLPADFISIIANRFHAFYQTGIISSTEYSQLRTDTSRMIRIVDGKNATSVPLTSVLSTKAAYEQIYMDKILEPHRQILQKCNLNDYITANLIYDKERNQACLNDIMNSIPLASGLVQKGQKIIDRGEIVNEQTLRIVESYTKENEKRSQTDTQIGMTIIGEAIYVAILLICFTIYLSMFRKDYFEKPRSISMLYSLVIMFSLFTSLLVRNSLGHVYMIPYAIVPIIVRVFMDTRTAFTTHFIMILLCACMLQHPFEFIAVQTVAGLVALYSLRELQYRSQLFRTAVEVTLASAAMCFGLDLIQSSMLSDIDRSTYNYLIVNGVLLLFAYPVLYIMEKTFGFISDITLIELSNTNNPLLRRLSEVCPGTFQHSIQVGNLAAEIANKIGANSQLVRTGALYHDIGKMNNPIYFTENQSGVNPHEALTEIESAQVIISHVTDGLKMAEKFNLPSIIKDFISTHHGQGKTKYFYVKYKNSHPDAPVDDLLFTYPGPNPFTREQAILMISDTIEAASRSLPDYTEKSIRGLVERLVDAMVNDGYFRECPITFRDIAYAKTVLIEKLKTIYHTRVSYPQEKG